MAATARHQPGTAWQRLAYLCDQMLNGVRDESDYVLVILQAFTSVRTCRLMRFPGPNGTVAHAEIETGDSLIIVEDASPYMGTQAPPVEGLPGSPSFLYI